MQLAKRVLACLLSDETLANLRLRAFTLMPNHLHLLAGLRQPELCLPDLIGNFKSYTTQLYWKRSQEVVTNGEISLPSRFVAKTNANQSDPLTLALLRWQASLRPEVVELRNWPHVNPEQFLKKRLWQTRLYDHVIRNEADLEDNIDYIALNPVREGYVSRPQFYPYTGFLF
jgi:REP element-mobilizing transposase RayT